MKHTNMPGLSGTEKLNIAIQRNRRRIRTQSAGLYSPILLFPDLPLAEMKASVIIPVKDESENIVNTLDALRTQRDGQGNQLQFSLYEILLLANNCTDNTYNVAAAYKQQYPELQLHIAEVQLEKKIAHIGTARRLLMDEAFRRHQLNHHDGIILSTDGDTEADVHWIINTLQEMSNGCDAVGGRILAKSVDDGSRLYYLQDNTYRCLSARLEAVIDPTESNLASHHFQCFGASLAVRCSAYHKAGRLPVIPFLEDEAFSRALYRVDAKVRKSAAVKVYTSSRLQGRVTAGFSVHLKHLADMKKENVVMYVESLPTLIKKWKIKKQLRECWLQRKKNKSFPSCLGSIAGAIHVLPGWLMNEIDLSQYFGECWEKTEHKMYSGAWRTTQKAVPVEEAIRELRQYLQE